MIKLRRFVPILCLATALSGLAAYAIAGRRAGPCKRLRRRSPMAPRAWRRPRDEMGLVLHKLNLAADQQTQIKAIFAGEKGQFDALHASAKANRQALAVTPPTDPGYATLVETEQRNAAARITLEHQTWRQIYESVLTKQQQQQIPGIVAAAQAARDSGMGARKTRDPQPPAD